VSEQAITVSMSHAEAERLTERLRIAVVNYADARRRSKPSSSGRRPGVRGRCWGSSPGPRTYLRCWASSRCGFLVRSVGR